MAALTPTFTSDPLPIGNKVLRTFRVSPTSNASDDEWVDTGLSWIDAVVGFSFYGTVAPTQGAEALQVPVFKKNASGTGATEGDDAGLLGIEVLSQDITVEVTVLGKV